MHSPRSTNRRQMPCAAGMLVDSKLMTDNNFLFYGDNLEVLRKHIKEETVDLCYIDPPFNSQRTYNQIYNNIGGEDHAQAQAFIDTWLWDDHAREGFDEIRENKEGRYTVQTVALIVGLHKVLGEGSLLAYLISLTQRITEIYRVLKPVGSFYMHCDTTAGHYIKFILDAVFCAQGGDYKNEIVWKRTTAHSDTKQGLARYGRIHDTIFFYTKKAKALFITQYTDYEQSYIDSHYRHIESAEGKPERRYRKDNITANKPGGDVEYGWPVKRQIGKDNLWEADLDNEYKKPKGGMSTRT